jgi:hypothetical protein
MLIFKINDNWQSITGIYENKKQERDIHALAFYSCDPAGARTQDPILKRDVLYQLSY